VQKSCIGCLVFYKVITMMNKFIRNGFLIAAALWLPSTNAFTSLTRLRKRNQRLLCRTTNVRVSTTTKAIHSTQIMLLQASPSSIIATPFYSSISADTILPIFSVLILYIYHLRLFKKESSGTSKTWRQYQADVREGWARYVRQTEGWLYAIQTLRNAITAQTFLASTVLSLLTVITGKIWDILRKTTCRLDKRLLTIQLTSIALTMLFSAYQFLQGVRLMTHAGFMFPVKKENTKVDKIMRQTQNSQWLGLRFMYISLGPIAWTVGGSLAFFVTSTGLFMFFRSIDKVPLGLYDEFQGEGI